MARSDSARGRTDGPLLRHPDTGHEVVPNSKAVEDKFRSRGYKSASGSTGAKKTTARKTTAKTTAKAAKS
jgi:hypothetical protein